MLTSTIRFSSCGIPITIGQLHSTETPNPNVACAFFLKITKAGTLGFHIAITGSISKRFVIHVGIKWDWGSGIFGLALAIFTFTEACPPIDIWVTEIQIFLFFVYRVFLFTVWKWQNFTVVVSSQNFREINVWTNKSYWWIISRIIFCVTVNFSLLQCFNSSHTHKFSKILYSETFRI